MLRAATLAAAVAAVLIVAAPGGASGHAVPAYTVVDLGTLGGTTSFATAINRSGSIVGYSATVASPSHAFVWRHGVMTDLGTLPGGSSSRANAINDRGQIVGFSDASTPSASGGDVVAPQAFLYSGGKLVDIDPNTQPSYTPASWAYGINDAGQIVGDVLAPSGDSLAFLYSRGAFATLPISGMEPQARGVNGRGQVVGSTDSSDSPSFLYASGAETSLGSARGQAEAINARGTIAGWTQPMGAPIHAFLSTGGAPTDLGTLGGATSQANALDDLGRVVGTSDVRQGAAHAFLYRDGAMLDLNNLIPRTSGWVLESATGINDRGEIVGDGAVNGVEHAFLLVPKSLHSRSAR